MSRKPPFRAVISIPLLRGPAEDAESVKTHLEIFGAQIYSLDDALRRGFLGKTAPAARKRLLEAVTREMDSFPADAIQSASLPYASGAETLFEDTKALLSVWIAGNQGRIGAQP